VAGRGDIEAGRSHITLYVKNSALTQGLKAAQQSLQGLGTRIAGIGAGLTAMGGAILAPIAGAISHFVAFGSELNDMSIRTGVAASALAELKFAAEQNGASMDDVEKAVKKMQKTTVDAGRGLKTATDAFKLLGLTTADFKGKSPDEQLQMIADRLGSVEDPAIRTAAAMEIFGKSGTQLLPMLENLRALRKEAQDAGLVPTDEAVAVADQLGDAFDKIKAQGLAALFEIGAAVGPMLLPALKIVSNIATEAIKWVRENGVIVRTVAAIGAGLVVAGTIVAGIGAVVFGMGAAFGVAATVLAGIAGVVAAIVSPIGLVVVGLAGAAAAWVLFTESGQSALAALMAFVAPAVEFIKTVLGGISDALMAGDLALAAQIGWAAVLLVFKMVQLEIMKGWFALRNAMLTAWGEVTLGIQTGLAFITAIFTGLLDQLVPGWRLAMDIIGQGAVAAWNMFKAAAQVAIAVIQVGLNALIQTVQRFFKGMQVATSAAIAVAPTVAAQGNEQIKEFLGIDVGKIFGDATTAAGAANAAGRQKLNQQQADREAADNEALDKQRKDIADKEKELAELRKRAADAKTEAEAKGPEAPPRPDIPDAGELQRRVSVGFSAAGLIASAGGGRDATLTEIKAHRKLAERQVELLEKIKDKPALKVGP
jgi:hypothetical protein